MTLSIGLYNYLVNTMANIFATIPGDQNEMSNTIT